MLGLFLENFRTFLNQSSISLWFAKHECYCELHFLSSLQHFGITLCCIVLWTFLPLFLPRVRIEPSVYHSLADYPQRKVSKVSLIEPLNHAIGLETEWCISRLFGFEKFLFTPQIRNSVLWIEEAFYSSRSNSLTWVLLLLWPSVQVSEWLLTTRINP